MRQRLAAAVEIRAGTIVHILAATSPTTAVLRASHRVLRDVYKDTFDYLHVREPAAFLALLLHCHFGGRPLIAAVLEKIVRHMTQFPDVWFASCDEIARWVLDTQRDADAHARRLLHSEAHVPCSSIMLRIFYENGSHFAGKCSCTGMIVSVPGVDKAWILPAKRANIGRKRPARI
jgi:hypothetical protein